MQGTLFIVGTPIGNLEDLSLRAARVLREADMIAAEDTRSAKTLLAHADALGTVNPVRRVISYFEGNEAEREEEIHDALAQGRDVAVISEGGMPLFFRMRADLWSLPQQDRFARHLSEQLEARVIPEEMFAPYLTVDVVIGRVEQQLREKGLFVSR